MELAETAVSFILVATISIFCYRSFKNATFIFMQSYVMAAQTVFFWSLRNLTAKANSFVTQYTKNNTNVFLEVRVSRFLIEFSSF